MPELPEVETMVRGIRPFVVGREIAAVRRCRCRYKPITFRPGFRQLATRLQGRTVASIDRLGKRAVFRFSTGDALVFEPRMTGLLLLTDPPDRGHLRVECRFKPNARYNSIWIWDRRGLGTLRLYTAGEFAEELGPGRLGPDALRMTEDDWRERCGRTSRAIKVALLDQKLTSGIGNLYASEILHRAQIHPAQPADQLRPRQIRLLSHSATQVLTEAIRYEGSTLGDGTYRNALNANGRYQNKHRVYNRADQLCVSCGKEAIQRIVQAQRSTFFCPVCQG